MDNNGDSYGYPPYEEDQNTAGSDPYAPRSYRDDPAGHGNAPYPYGQEPSPYGQKPSPYGQEPSPHGQDGGYPSGGADYSEAHDYSSRYPRTSYGEQGGYPPRAANPYEQNAGSASGVHESDAYDTRGDSYGHPASRYPERDDPYASRRTTIPRGREDYARRGDTGRYSAPDEDLGFDRQDSYERPSRSPHGRKKRSKLSKFMHALGLYLAQLPSKTLVIFGGSFAMILVVIILLAVLLPNNSRTETSDDGQLAISDITPTPSIAPTDTPAPTEDATPSPEPAVLEEPISKAGTISDVIPDIQMRLVELGYMEEPEDGFTNKYGPLTKTAIRLFQMKNFSDYNAWDGIIGNDTYSLLMSDDAKSYYLQRGDGDDRTKIITKLVDDVTALQQRLIELGYLAAGSDTGLYGNTTVLAVQKFQEYHGLDPIDGIAGQETLALINSSEAMDAVTGEANNKTKLNTTPDASASAETTETTPAP